MAGKKQLVESSAAGLCGNCGARLEGKYCHQCGQSARNPMRHLPEFVADAADTVFSLDSRFACTLPMLFLKPGRLTLDYFAGKRARYIPPFRLAFLLALALFFVFRIGAGDLNFVNISTTEFSEATTSAEVDKLLAKKVEGIDQALASPEVPEVAKPGLRQARERIRQQAAKRRAALAGLAEPAVPPPASTVPGASPAMTGELLDVDDPWDEGWEPQKHPVAVSWLPDFANRWLQDMALQLHANRVQLESDDPAVQKAARRRVAESMISVIPQTLFLMLPVFALLLTVLYVFKRRLYAEHLIVAMHSHAFLFLAALGLVLLHLAATASASVPVLSQAISLVQIALWCWIPIYLLLMQKRVYGQGWPMTLIKYLVVGVCYLILLGFVLVAAGLVGLASA